jgi:8-oxo-dGTP diphosphatase
MESQPSHIKVAVDAIVFGYSKADGLTILLIKRKYDPFKNAWAIPGGFVLEETGITVNYLEQLYSFGEPNRDPRQRVISIAYFALVNSRHFATLKASTDAEEAEWFSINKLPALAFDHKKILQVAIERLKAKVRYEPIGFELLDKEFAFSDLEKLYSILLDKPIDRRNFTKKILSLDILEDTGKLVSIGVGRPSKVYQFNKKRYNQLQKEGIYFEV